MRSAIFITAVVLAAVATAQTVVPYKPNLRLHPFTSLPQQNYSLIQGATVSVDQGFASGDQLMMDYEGEYQISSTYDSMRGVLYIQGLATVSEYINAIETVVFSTTATDGKPRQLVWALGANTFFLPETGHSYSYYANVGVSWNASLANCATYNYFGMPGYMATITSSQEMTGLASKLASSAWIGGAPDVNNQWSWQAGPEAGTAFWSGLSMYAGGVAVDEEYTAWGRFQPDGYNAIALVPSLYEATGTWKNMNNMQGVSGYLCEFGDMPTTATLGTYGGAVLLEYGCSLFTNAADCGNQASVGCTWNGMCIQSSCVQYTTELLCTTNALCQWSVDSGVGLCTATPCGVFSNDESTCVKATGCAFAPSVNGADTCYDAECSDYATSSSCASATGCTWHLGRCATTAGLNCTGLDIIYVIDGSALMAQPFGLHSSGYVGIINVLARADEVLTQRSAVAVPQSTDFGQRVGYVLYGSSKFNGVTPTGTGTGGRLTGDATQKSQDLAYLEALFPASSTRTLTQAMTQVNSMVQNSGSVAAGRQVIVVVIAAGAISDAAAVQSMLASWSYTFIGVALSQYPESSLSSQAAVQSLGAALPKKSNIFELSIDDFTDSIIWGICSTMSKPSTGVPTCAVYTTASACWQDPTCGWSSASMVCETSACLAHDATSCKADSTCSWDSNNKFCRSACSGTSASNCGPCVTNPSEDSCIGDPNGCVYNASNYIKCQLDNCAPITNPTACAAQPNCIFTSQSICMLDPCTSRTKAGQAFCQALPQCSWTNIQGTQYGCRLGTPCGGYQGEKACAGDSRCQWSVDISPSACVPAPCMKYNANPLTAPALCMADSACMWRLANQTGVGQAMCMVRTCDMYSTACACSADDGCVWRNNTCKDSRYVQCPAIDIFFLVEGTSVMAKEFGRHPNGFVGIIESIRGWSMDAPWSPDTTSTGFRMGMALYGGNTAQLTPGNGIGNGEDFVMKPSDWYGATKELDFFENSFSSYAAGATGVQLRPGLAAAKNMFTRSDPSRTKMLVILGVSPFTDGSSPDTAIAPAIKDLEAMGVQIFSNIVRRFGSITDAETLASSYMTPVASEPSSSHFLFATIDEIRSTLLDQFCDPSTTTGQALGVSRDNTLPCSWLAQNECSMQTNCVWNASGVKTCPLPTQCPNLGCDPLPTNLASTFTCAQCTKVSGAISCQSTPVASTKGTCQPNSCALNYCGMSTCNADTNCLWNSDTVRCEANLCGPITNVDTCNAQLGCYWNALSSPSACMRSDSWRQRSQVTCTAVTVTQNKNQLVIYRWKTDVQPAVCIQKRCENFDQTLCQSHTSSEGCYYDPSNLNGQTCLRQTCPYTNSLDCHSDSNCYWNPFDTLLGTCSPVPQDGSCVLSGYSNYTQCTASCGNAIQTKSRRILRFPKTSAASLSCANVAVNMGRATGETTIVITQPCNVDASCTAHCGAIKNSLTCSKDISCYWNATCLPKTFHSCAEYDQSLCLGMDVCAWNSVTSFCEPVVTVCTLFNTSQTCALATATQNCHWRTGATINSMGAQYNAPTQLFNPGPLQEPIFVFPTLSLSSSDIIWGATVTIEQNFQRGKDQLQLLYPSAMQTSWDPTSGTLSLTGRGTINDYANAIRYVTFTSVSVDTSARLVTWSLLNNTVYSAVTGHVYRYYPATGISFTNAQALCSQASFFGMQGYLAVVQTQHENDMLFQKLWAAGWLGAGDLSSGVWRWNTGPFAGAPLAFWQGPSAAAGGRNVGGYFANWNTIVDEPNQTAVGTNGLYMDSIGTWHAEPTNWVGGAGYICEFGGMVNDATPAFDVYGTAVVGAAGCLPDECTYHNNQTGCTLDTDCYWNNNRCQLACSGYSTPLQCGTNTNCAWDDTVVPPMCAFNPCSGPNSNNCTNPQCVWDQGQNLCVFRTGCAARLDATSCSNYAACVWNSGACEQKPCSSLSSADDCGANPLCLYVTGTGCTTAYCRAGNQGDCESDSRCEWNAVTSTASVSFTPGGSPVQPFTTLATPGSVGNLVVDGITVMITGGFEEGMDTLTVNSAVLSSSSWTMNWNSQSGTLILYAPPATMALDAVSFLQNYVTFYSTSGANQARTIAYSLGVNSFMGTNGNKFIKYVPATTGNAPTTFAAAQTLCSNTQFFGASGQLASLTNELDALNLARLSPTGWLGAQAVNNKWTWTDNGATFWDISAGKPGPITASNGTSFGYWAKSQPLFAQSSATQYAVVSSSGMWSTLVAGRNQGLGAICEYPVPSGIVGSTRTAMPSGCFMKPCVGLGQGTCLTTPGCSWNIDSNNPNTCSVDTFCDAAPTPSNCTALAGCYWSYSYSYCATASATTCDKYTTQATCEQTSNTYCEWASNKLARGSNSLGACVSTACGPLTPDACVGNPLCVLQGTTCLIRQCPYVSPKFCFQDPSCNWDYSSSTCFPDACTYNGDQNTCAAQSACYWSNNQCFRTSCVGTTAATCQKVPYCIFTAGTCTKTTCYQLTGTACINNANCNWITDSTTNQLTCITARCKAYSNSNDCASSNTTGSTCSWSNGQCIQGAAPASCQKQVSPNLWWLYLLCLIILVLLGLIAWRLYLAYSKGLSFFEPARTNVKYSPHAQYAADLFEEAQTTAVESNAPGYQRPNINDL